MIDVYGLDTTSSNENIYKEKKIHVHKSMENNRAFPYLFERFSFFSVGYTQPVLLIGSLSSHIHDLLMTRRPEAFGTAVPRKSSPFF